MSKHWYVSKLKPIQPRLFKRSHLEACSTMQKRTWHLFDAQQQVVGRMAVKIAPMLLGKHCPGVVRGDGVGDTIVVINAGKIQFTGKKWKMKLYRKHSGYPGALKELTAHEVLQRDPCRILMHAVKGMLPNNKSRNNILSRLKVYEGSEHPHQSQFKIDVRRAIENDDIVIPRLPEPHQTILDAYRGMGDAGEMFNLPKDVKVTFAADTDGGPSIFPKPEKVKK